MKADDVVVNQAEWTMLSVAEKKKQLYLQQKDVLLKFLERNAITKAEYEKSLGDLTVKMGMSDLREDCDGTR